MTHCLPEEDQTQYEYQLAMAKEFEMTLARLLQRAAFHFRTVGGQRTRAEMEQNPNFDPAPVYMNQACAFALDPDLMTELKTLLTQSAN